MAKKLPKWFNDDVHSINMKLIDAGWSWDEIVNGFEQRIKEYKDEKWFREDGKEITKTVKNNGTIIIPGISYFDEKEATAIATRMRKYVFPIYEKVNRKLTHYGYAVPA